MRDGYLPMRYNAAPPLAGRFPQKRGVMRFFRENEAFTAQSGEYREKGSVYLDMGLAAHLKFSTQNHNPNTDL